jgi:hypothetical protein
MSTADKCETLFGRVDDLGAGITALGDLLRAGKDDACPSTLNGIGIVLFQLGEVMRGLNSQFLDASYFEIVNMEKGNEQQAPTTGDHGNVVKLKALLDGAVKHTPIR